MGSAFVRFQEMVEMLPSAAVVLDGRARAVSANNSWHELAAQYPLLTSALAGSLTDGSSVPTFDLRDDVAASVVAIRPDAVMAPAIDARTPREAFDHVIGGERIRSDLKWVVPGTVPARELRLSFSVVPDAADFVLVTAVDSGELAVESSNRERTVTDGIAGPQLFLDLLTHALALTTRHEFHPAVLAIGLGGTADLSSRYGQQARAELIRLVLSRLKSSLRPGDVVTHLGNDDFAVLLPDVSGAYLAEVVSNRLIEDLARPCRLSVARVEITPWVGVAVADRCVDAKSVFETACRQLDMLRGGSVSRVMLAAGDAVGRVVTTRVTHGERVIDLTDFRQDDLVAYFQPIVDNRNGTVVAAEALARWRHPLHGILTAGDFFGPASNAGMLGDLTDQALVSAAESWADLRDSLPDIRPHLFVNLSPEQMLGPMLTQRLVHLLRATDIPADEFVVEITENALSSHLDDILAVMSEIRSMGIRIALDDFGSGYSSLSRLRRMPVDVIKIDQELVAGLEADVKGQQMLGRLAAMAEDLELEAIVEGVETAADAAIVSDLGFHYVQGFYYGHPIASDRFAERVMFPSAMARPA